MTGTRPEHGVEFYEANLFPAHSVARYFHAGLENGEGALLVATAEHAARVKMYLRAFPHDLDKIERSGLLCCIDANETLAAMRGHGSLDERAFEAVLDKRLEQAVASSPSGRIRAFGELVNLCALDHDLRSAMQLERCWNQRTGDSIRQRCAYSLDTLRSSTPEGLYALCDLHDDVLPRRSRPGSRDWIGLLLLRSRVLQRERASRKMAENALASWEGEYARLFDAHVAAWCEWMERNLEESHKTETNLTPEFASDLERTLEASLKEIVAACEQASKARKSAPACGPEWNKRTGEILAHGKLTYILLKLQKFLRSDSF